MAHYTMKRWLLAFLVAAALCPGIDCLPKSSQPVHSFASVVCGSVGRQHKQATPHFRLSSEFEEYRLNCCQSTAQEREVCIKEFQLLRLSEDSCKEQVTTRDRFLHAHVRSDPREVRLATSRLLKSLQVDVGQIELDYVRRWQEDCCSRTAFGDKLKCYRSHVETYGQVGVLTSLQETLSAILAGN